MSSLGFKFGAVWHSDSDSTICTGLVDDGRWTIAHNFHSFINFIH